MTQYVIAEESGYVNFTDELPDFGEYLETYKGLDIYDDGAEFLVVENDKDGNPHYYIALDYFNDEIDKVKRDIDDLEGDSIYSDWDNVTTISHIIDVSFEKDGDNKYLVNAKDSNGVEFNYGVLLFDKDQEAWVLWTGMGYSEADTSLSDDSDDGVTYEESLEETKQEIIDDLC